MANKIKIPGELESIAKDGIVASAAAIKDYRNEDGLKTQQEINTIILQARDTFNTGVLEIKEKCEAVEDELKNFEGIETVENLTEYVLELATTVNLFKGALVKIAEQLNATYNSEASLAEDVYTPGYKFEVVTEAIMLDKINQGTTEKNTIYFVEEEE